jgi:uncharacterized protein YaiI (UPF0178 family)
MKIYVDADACPKTIKAILCKAAIRVARELIFVANQPVMAVAHPLIKSIQVGHGFDVADDYIAEQVQAHDLVITADIPLANQVIDKGAFALNPRGELYDKNSIKQRLALRNFMDEMRSSGVQTGGPKPLDKQDIQKFSNALDRYLAKIVFGT